MNGYGCGRRAVPRPRAARPVGPMAAMSMVLATALVLAGCGGGDGGSPGAATPSPIPSASAAAFTLEVLPAQFVGMTIGGQRVVFLITVSGTEADGAAEIAATAEGAIITIEPQPLMPGVVGEVSLVPASVTAESQLTVTITAARGGVEQSQERTLTMMPGDETPAEDAALHLAPFVSWLATSHPELGITPQTAWDASRGSWVLIVEHYQYISEDWELGLAWHVMIPPDDWARIYLRHRWTESEPSLAFEISSFAGGTQPIEIPAEGIWR